MDYSVERLSQDRFGLGLETLMNTDQEVKENYFQSHEEYRSP
jgi:hypothetical protein